MRKYGYLLLIAILLCVGIGVWLNSRGSITPRDLRDFRILQERVRATAEKVIPAVVAVEQAGVFGSPEGSAHLKCCGSGVIISPDGLILSQHHVSHRYFWDGEGPWRNKQPGEATKVILADGREMQARLLGADESNDVSLLQLVEPGPYPFIPIASSDELDTGDWVIQIGHPIGYQSARGAVTRLGRVLSRDGQFFATDCNVIGGDSGGPILDLDGCLVGIPGALVIDEPHMADWRWSRAKWEKPWSMRSPVQINTSMSVSAFRQHRTELLEGKLLPFDKQHSEPANAFVEAGPSLPHSHWTQGEETTEALKQVVDPVWPSVVEILGPDNQHVAAGTIVSSDGLVVAIAATLPSEPRCRLVDGKILAASKLAVDNESGLALLSVGGSRLSPISLSQRAMRPPVGSVVASPIKKSFARCSVSMGIVSVQPPQPTSPTTEALPHFFEGDMPVLAEQIGTPVVDLRGTVIGLVVDSRRYGCRILAIDSVAARVKHMQDE